MPRCNICGEPCKWTNQISDKMYVVRDNSPVCNTCFRHWAAGDDSYLQGKIAEKLKNAATGASKASGKRLKSQSDERGEHHDGNTGQN